MNSLKEAFRMQNLLKNLNFFGELNLGLILTAVGIVYFKNPNHFAFGGTSGLSILLADLFPKINRSRAAFLLSLRYWVGVIPIFCLNTLPKASELR